MESSNLLSSHEYKEVMRLLSPYSHLKKLVFTGNIGESQDIPAVLEAVNLIRQRRDFILLMVGSGREENRVRQLILDYDLGGHVKMVGRFPVEYMSSFYHLADALLLPLGEDPLFEITLPGKTQSYLFAGRPIVGFLSGEGADVLRRSNSAFVCDAGDVEGLAEQIVKFCDADPSELEELGRSAKQYAVDNFLPERVMSTLISVSGLR